MASITSTELSKTTSRLGAARLGTTRLGFAPLNTTAVAPGTAVPDAGGIKRFYVWGVPSPAVLPDPTFETKIPVLS